MREHLFLCGLDDAQRGHFTDGQMLSLDEVSGNLKLKLDQMRRRLAGNEPERLTDFLEIASYVFAADRVTSCGTAILKNMGEHWRRAFHLVIGVRDPAFWNGQAVKHALSEALGFLSEDDWRFEFIQNRHPRPLQGYLDIRPHEANTEGGTSIVLFSGGLDLLAGAVHELRTTNRHVVLVSHRNIPKVGAQQVELATKLADDFRRRVTHVFVDNSLTEKLDDREETQRTRSFFFTAVAAVAAHIEKSDRIRFFENGVMSVNLPIETQVVGARASRSTHPRSLQLLQAVIDNVAAHRIDVDNPFVWKTKVEVVAELAASKQAHLIGRSLSCSNSRTANKTYQPHCGRCIQCVHRRLSTLGAGAADLDEAEGYEADLLIDPTDDGPDRVMALSTISLALDCAQSTELALFGPFADEFGKVLQAYPVTEHAAATRKLLDLFRRHGNAVFEIVSDAVRIHSKEITGQTLPPSSLLALLICSNLSLALRKSPATPPRLPDPPPSAPRLDMAELKDNVLVAIDDKNRRFHVWGGAVLDGDAIFPIMKRLARLRLEDHTLLLAPRNYRGLVAKVLANELQLSDEGAVRSAIRRARAEFSTLSRGTQGAASGKHALIQQVRGKGYRLHPDVQIVSMEELNSL